MATLKQKLAFKHITEKHRPVSVVMREIGYATNTAVKPKNLTESKGWKELCEASGLTDEFLLGALHSDIKKKPKNRKPELELAFKIKGRLKENDDKPNENKTQVNILINVTQDLLNAKPVSLEGNESAGEKSVQELLR